jgi:hypothetical protein
MSGARFMRGQPVMRALTAYDHRAPWGGPTQRCHYRGGAGPTCGSARVAGEANVSSRS